MVRIAELEGYTGIENGIIPQDALKSVYHDTTVGKAFQVDQPLTIGDGLSGGEFIGDTPITITVDSTVIRETDDRLSDAREWTAPLVPLDVALEGTSEDRMAWSPLRVQQTISAGVDKYGVTSVNSKTGPAVELTKDDIGLPNVPNIDTSNADNITSGTLDSNRLQFGNTSNSVTEGNDSRLSNSREWIAPTAPDEVISQPNNTTRYAWTAQQIWKTIKSWFSTINSDDLPEGTNNLYYTENRVSSNPAVQANTTKIGAEGPVTTHSDVTDAGSGQIITSAERSKLNNLDPNAEPNLVTSVSGKTGDVLINKSDVGLSNVPDIDTSNANNITSGTLNSNRLQFGNTSNTVTEGNDSRLFNSREWIAPTAPDEVVSQPNNTTRYAWTAQQIWKTIKSWFSTINSDDLPEGTNNLYYTENRVSSNPAVQANTTKIGAEGPVTTHSDVTDAGSGQIITSAERSKLNNLDPNAEPNLVTSVSGKTGDVLINKSDVGLSNVPNVNTANATNITSGVLNGSRLQYGTVAGTPAQGNDARFSNSREWTASTVSQSEAQSGQGTTRRAWTSQRVRQNVSNYTQPFTSAEKNKLSQLDNSKYLPINGTAVNSSKLDDVSLDKFVRNDQDNVLYKDINILGTVQFRGMSGTQFSNIGGLSGVDVISADSSGAAFMSFHRPGAYAVYFGLDKDNQLKVGGWSLGSNVYKIWTSGNDGSGSGLDADLWDGNQFSSYLNQALLTTSNPTFNTVYTNSWFRSIGKKGWYSETYKGGIYMTDTNWIRTYNKKALYSSSEAIAVSHTGAGAIGCKGVRIGSGNIGINGYIYFGNSNRQMLNLYNSTYGIGVQSNTLYIRSASDFAFYSGGSHNDSRRNSGGGTTVWSYNKDNDEIAFFRNPRFTKSIVIENDGPTIQFKDNSVGRSFWIHNNSNRLYILSDKNNDNGWESPHPAYWDDPTQKAYFWDKQVLTIETGIRKDIVDTVNQHTNWADNKGVRFGNDADYRILHDGNVTVHNNYSGHIYHKQRAHGKNFYFQGEDSQGVNRALLYLYPNSSVNLFYKGIQKFRTESYGVRVTPSMTLYDPTATYIDFNNNESADFNARLICTSGTSSISTGNLEIQAGEITLAPKHPSSSSGMVYIASNNSSNSWAFNDYSDGFLYIQQRKSDKTFDANVIRFGKSEIRHYAPLVNSSSKEIKDVQGSVSNGLEFVNKLNPVIYNYKGQSNTEVGLIAEEVPDDSHLVYGQGSDSGIDYTKLSIYLIDAVKQLTKRIEELEKA